MLSFPDMTVKSCAELAQCLHQLQSKTSSASAQSEHYILYEVGNQRSLLQVKTDSTPFRIRYCDFDRRPAPEVVRETVNNFFQQHGVSSSAAYFKEVSVASLTLAGIVSSMPRLDLEQARRMLRTESLFWNPQQFLSSGGNSLFDPRRSNAGSGSNEQPQSVTQKRQRI